MQNSKHKKRYSKISVDKRIKLVALVLDQGVTITKAAKMLHVKRPTAKIIIKRFQRNGTFFHKKMPPLPAKNNTQAHHDPKLEEISFEIALGSKQDSASAQVQQNDPQCQDTISPSSTQAQISFFLFYQPYFDYHCFM